MIVLYVAAAVGAYALLMGVVCVWIRGAARRGADRRARARRGWLT